MIPPQPAHPAKPQATTPAASYEAIQVVAAAGADTGGAGAIPGEHLPGRPPIELHQVPAGVAAVQPGRATPQVKGGGTNFRHPQARTEFQHPQRCARPITGTRPECDTRFGSSKDACVLARLCTIALDGCPFELTDGSFKHSHRPSSKGHLSR